MKTNPDCPYEGFPYRCTNKNWCVRKEPDCKSTTADIRLRVGPYEKTFRRPLKMLLSSLETAVNQTMSDGVEKQSALEEILMAVKLIDRITDSDAVLSLDGSVIKAIENLDEMSVTLSLDDNEATMNSVIGDLMDDLSLIRRAYGAAILDIEDQEYDEVEYMIEPEDKEVAKEILKSSMKDLENLKASINVIVSNLYALAA